MESNCPNCGCNEFVTQLNAYDVYCIVDGKPEYQRSELTDETDLYCRECGEKRQAPLSPRGGAVRRSAA
ncbi:MAG: hypothetical protein MdMp014T_1521 [Treponematales bacterium]